jgi:glycine dehydrogenase subunit 1
MPTFTPHTPEEIKQMLGFLGLDSISELYSHIPDSLKLGRQLAFQGLDSEFDVLSELSLTGETNINSAICFAGYGAYDRLIPAATKQLSARSEFVTAYTPYQPEVAQGVLQAIFEYQTFITRLYGTDIANASLYDGSSALVEAINIATSLRGSKKVVLSESIFHNYRQVADTFSKGTDTEIVTVKESDLIEDLERFIDSKTAAVVVQTPNRYGYLVDLEELSPTISKHGCLFIVVMDPIAASVLKPPGKIGADIVVGEGQPIGMPLSYGGPYLGLFSLREDLVRKLPGRLVGRTYDLDSKIAYVTTLRSREQDIRREKASSNVCTNQTLMAVTAAIQLSWLGTSGILKVAQNSFSAAHYLHSELHKHDFEFAYDKPFLWEFSLRFNQNIDKIIDAMLEEGFLAGVKVTEEFSKEEFLVVAATEKRTRSEIDSYVNALVKITR